MPYNSDKEKNKTSCGQECKDCKSFSRECNGCPVIKGHLCWMIVHVSKDVHRTEDEKQKEN